MMIDLSKICNWCKEDNRIHALLLVGSYAIGKEKADSDIDLVIMTDNQKGVLEPNWIDIFGEIDRYQVEEYGACTSIRVYYMDGTEIEYGIVDDSWIDSPLDAGTRRVLEDGYKLLYATNGISVESIERILRGE